MNKKIYLLMFAIITLTSNYSNAQRFGLKVAFSKPDYKFEDVKQDKSQLYQGYQIGIYGRSDSRIYLQPEIYYHKKEGRFTNEPGKQEFDQSLTLHTINIPLVLGLNVIKHKNFTLHGFGGVQSTVVVDNNISTQKTFSPITKSNIENITVKYFWGAGIDIFFLSFDVRYYTEPTNTISESNDISFPYLKNYYTFNLGLKLLK
jgi:hypothetical protein